MSSAREPMSDAVMWRIVRAIGFGLVVGFAGIVALELSKPILVAILRGTIT